MKPQGGVPCVSVVAKNVTLAHVPRPSHLMRQWHPDLFPDSSIVEAQSLPKGFLEYHLETLTARKQEQQFEDFCRRLSELEICPNIKPQTGPTGGGDSKLDAASYPMAPALAERYYWGNPTPPTTECWGFAFSCKKTWKQKIKDDAAKIAGVDRRFKKVYFITSQFARDKVRAALEDELTKKYGFEAHILDRAWIVEKVIDRKHYGMAIRTLGISVTEDREERLGPRDTERQQELEEILERPRDVSEYQGNDFALTQDYLQAALLTRGLGRARHEVEGFFVQARRLAERTGNLNLSLRCGYNQAWTAHWWFEDLEELHRIYGEIEGLISDTTDVDECELIVNLWILLWGADKRGQAGSLDLKVVERGVRLSNVLVRMASEGHRPNSALQARSNLLMMKIFEEFGDDEVTRSVLVEMRECLDKCEGLGTYPALTFIDRFKLSGQLFGRFPEFEALFQRMCDVSRARSGETSEGRLLYERGMQQLQNGEARDALRNLGRARARLYKDETLRMAARASLGCSQAYASIGMFWAARTEALVAAHVALRKDEGDLFSPAEGFWALVHLARIDLYLGRFPAFLAWYETAAVLIGYFKGRRFVTKRFEDQIDELDTLFALRIMKLSSSEVASLSSMLDTMERLNLTISRWVMMYRLGRVEQLADEFGRTNFDSPTTVENYFEQFRQIDFEDDVREPTGLAGERYVVFATKVLGVEYRIRARNEFGPVVFSENLLGIIEAAFVLARWENLAFIVDEFPILVDVSEEGKTPPEIRFERGLGKAGHPLIWKSDLSEWLGRGPRDEVADYLKLVLFHLLFMTTIDPIEDLREELDHWHREETFTRALSTSPVSIIVEDLIGRSMYDADYWRAPSPPPSGGRGQ